MERVSVCASIVIMVVECFASISSRCIDAVTSSSAARGGAIDPERVLLCMCARVG